MPQRPAREGVVEAGAVAARVGVARQGMRHLGGWVAPDAPARQAGSRFQAGLS